MTETLIKKIKTIQTFLKNIVLITFITIIYVIIFELIARVSFSFLANNKNIFYYGLNKNLSFEIVDVTEMKFNIINLDKNNNDTNSMTSLKVKNNKGKKKIVWTFGASLTYGFSCGKSSSSWPNELDNLDNSYDVINFGFPSKYSDDSIKLLNYNLSKTKNIPDIIIWGHRDEEMLAISFGLKRNANKINQKFTFKSNNENLLLLQISKTAETNLFTFFVLKHVFNKLKKRFNIYQDKNISRDNLKDKDYSIAIENFKLNTLEAIKNSTEKGVEKFVIISLASEDEFTEDTKSLLVKKYFETVEKIVDGKKVLFIDTFNHLKQIEDFNYQKLYCENKHFSLYGNKKIAEITYNYLNN